MSYCADQNITPNKDLYLPDCTTSYLVSLVVYQGIKSIMGHNLSEDYLKAAYTPKNGATNSVISVITTPRSFISIDPNDPSVKSSTQSQFSKSLSNNSIFYEVINLMSSFNHKSFKNTSRQDISTQ